MLGLTQAAKITNNKIVIICVGLYFTVLNMWKFSDNQQYIHELLKYVFVFYLCIYVG